MTPTQEMEALFARLQPLHRGGRYDLRALLPMLEHFVTILRSRPQDRALFARELAKLVDRIDYDHKPNGVYAARHVIDFSMRALKWPEVERALKDRHDREPSDAIRLWLETMIREIYDLHWAGGRFDLTPEESIWDELRRDRAGEQGKGE